MFTAFYYLLVMPLSLFATAAMPPLYTELRLSDQYSAALFACHVPQRSAHLLEIVETELRGLPVTLVKADRNYDGAIDMILVYDHKDTTQSPFPHYYVYDTNFDGLPDKAYRDGSGNGVCQEMDEVPVRYVIPGGKES